MKYITILSACLIFITISLNTSFAKESAKDSRIKDAIDALRSSKHSTNPTNELNIAANCLGRSEFKIKGKAAKMKAKAIINNNIKDGYRKEAIQVIEKIIDTKPAKIDFNRMVDEAIAKCEKAM